MLFSFLSSAQGAACNVDQVKYWAEEGKSGYNVFKYLMIRRPGQAPLSSKVLMFGGSSAPKNFTMESRQLQVWTVC